RGDVRELGPRAARRLGGEGRGGEPHASCDLGYRVGWTNPGATPRGSRKPRGRSPRYQLQSIRPGRSVPCRVRAPHGPVSRARGRLPEHGFVYVIVPEAKRAQLESLSPLATIQVTARVRTGRTRFLGNPVLDLISLETLP